MYKERLDDLNPEKQARLEILSQNRKDFQTQVASIRLTLEKISDKNVSQLEKIRILIREQIIIIISTLSAILVGTTTIILSIIGDFGGDSEQAGGPPSKDKGTLKKWLYRLTDALKILAGKAAEALPAIVGSVVGSILTLLGKVVGFVAEHTWALIVFVVGVIGWWLMQKVKND